MNELTLATAMNGKNYIIKDINVTDPENLKTIYSQGLVEGESFHCVENIKTSSHIKLICIDNQLFTINVKLAKHIIVEETNE